MEPKRCSADVILPYPHMPQHCPAPVGCGGSGSEKQEAQVPRSLQSGAWPMQEGVTEPCSVLFILGLDTRFSPIPKERKQKPLLPPFAHPKLSNSFPQVHKTIKYSLKWKKQEVVYPSSHKLGSPSLTKRRLDLSPQ